MKKRWIAAVAVLAVICLSACQKQGQNGGAQTGNTSGSGQSGTVQGGSAGSSGSTGSTQEITGQPAPADTGNGGSGTTQENTPAPAGDTAVQNDPPQDGPAQDSALALNTYDVVNQSGELPDPAAAAEATDIAAGNWDGTYTSDSGESVSMETVDEYSVSFTFAQSGLYGTAEKEGDSALFHGEDSNNIVFELSGDMLYVTITNDNGDPTDDSPLAGSYARQ